MSKFLDKTGLGTVWEKIKKLLAKDITWSELKALRDASELTPGALYRITDYECTTTLSGTLSAGHQYDIIVKALSSGSLSEIAEAAPHEGDTYFANCTLSAWKLWYCLDNDTSRFAWADSTNGKGVVYRMIDEYNNDVPYDFKNIQFIRYKVTATEHSNLEGTYVGTYQGKWMSDLGFTIDETDSVYMYTFTTTATDVTAFFAGTEEAKDGTVLGNSYVINNVIDGLTNDRALNNIVFCGNCKTTANTTNPAKSNQFCQNIFAGNNFDITCNGYTINNTFGHMSSQITTGYRNREISFDEECYNIVLGYENGQEHFDNGCFENIIGNNCNRNCFVNCCASNTIGDSCVSNVFIRAIYNTIGSSCTNNVFINSGNNTLGEKCVRNTFIGCASYNTLGASCTDNYFGETCQNNTLGDNCTMNKFDIASLYNTFGNNGHGNVFTSYNIHNTFKDYCSYNTFYPYCRYIDGGHNYVQQNVFDTGVRYITLSSETEPSSASTSIERYHFHNGIKGTSSSTVTITIPEIGRAYQTEVAMDSSGNLKMWCDADNTEADEALTDEEIIAVVN